MEVVRQACYDGNIEVILRFVQFGKYQSLLIDAIKLYVKLYFKNKEVDRDFEPDFEQFLDLVKQQDPTFDYNDYVQCAEELGWGSDDDDEDIDDRTLLMTIANDQYMTLPYQEAKKELAILAYSLHQDKIVDLLFQQ